ncbi:MAG: ferrichrome ABC transporter ATP-binding protein [Leifsonia xyli]|jgi:iron complex transport system ATP-binding protein|nr:MAG: ferrichrome ABC transporter ATP-binding protein [Leifsonia xyli]
MTLRCDGVTVRYGAREALKGFSLSLPKGEVRALIGPNGSGKSTALHALAGLIRTSAGAVTLDGSPIASIGRRELARRLAFLPQAPTAPDGMTVEQLVRQGRFAHVGLFGGYGPSDREAVAWAIEAAGLAPIAGRALAQLSGGERQRAWIAAALAQEADFLLLDEPTSFLDIGHQIEVLELTRRLATDRGTGIIVAIHDLNHAMAIADRISLLDRGALMIDADAGELARSGLIERCFGVRGRFETGRDGRPSFHADIASR